MANDNAPVMARLMAQVEGQGADLVTLRALVEEASELGAVRALESLGLHDARARRDMDELRELLQAWRDAKKTVWKEVVAWGIRILLAALFVGMSIRLGARLSLAPVRAITGVAALGTAGDEQPLATQDYAIDIDGRGEGWVRVPGPVPSGRVAVRYRAGLSAGWNGVPEPLRQGVVRLAAHFYAHRDGADGRGPPAAVTALWLPYRRLRLC